MAPKIMPSHSVLRDGQLQDSCGVRRSLPVRGRGNGCQRGLGLFICRSIVAVHGGRSDVGSDTGKGASFLVRIPLVQPPESQGADEPA